MLALVLTVPGPEAELAADALWALGVTAVEEREDATTAGMVELWTSLGEDRDVVRAAAAGFPARWRWHCVEVDDRVLDTWRAYATPTWVAPDLVTCPAWVDFTPTPGVTVVRVEPGVTFGLGDHPSTVGCLHVLRHLVRPGNRVLDVGCGSGVLAVAAVLLGAAGADAVDISPAATAVTLANAERNGVAGRITASTTPLAEVDRVYDVVVANILAPVLVGLAPDLVRVVAPGGALVVSGLLEGRSDHVEAALAPLEVVDRHVLDSWATITLRHP